MLTTARRSLLAGLAGTTAPVGAAFLAACGAQGQTTTPATALDTRQKYKISYWHWGTQEYFERERRSADLFQQKFPNIEVEVTLNPSGNFQDKMWTLFVGGTPPEVHILDMQVAPDWGNRNVLLDLKQFLKSDKTLGLAFYEKAPMTKQALDIMSYKEQVLGLPGEAGPNFYYYNADLFRRAGLKTPNELWKEDRWTWEAMADALVKIARQTGSGWEVAGAATGLHRLWINAAGGREFDDVKSPKKCLYDEPAAIDALQLLQDLRHKFKVTPVDFNREVGMNDTDAFRSGKVAMMARWTTGVGVYKAITDFKWGMVPYPKKKNYANDFATSGPAIAKDSKAQAAAWEWVKFRVGAEGSVSHARDGTSVYFAPEARKAALDAHKAIPTLETPTSMVDMLEGGKHNFVRLLAVDQAKIHGDLLNPELGKIWRNEESAPTVARRVTAAVNDFLKTNPQ